MQQLFVGRQAIFVLMDVSMERILSEMPLSAALKAAILQKEGPCGEALECALAYEELDWKRVRYRNLEIAEIREIYLESSAHAFREQSALAE